MTTSCFPATTLAKIRGSPRKGLRAAPALASINVRDAQCSLESPSKPCPSRCPSSSPAGESQLTQNRRSPQQQSSRSPAPGWWPNHSSRARRSFGPLQHPPRVRLAARCDGFQACGEAPADHFSRPRGFQLAIYDAGRAPTLLLPTISPLQVHVRQARETAQAYQDLVQSHAQLGARKWIGWEGQVERASANE